MQRQVRLDSAEREQSQDRKAGLKVKTENGKVKTEQMKDTHKKNHTAESSVFDAPITFDRFVRGLLIVLGFVGAYYLLNVLSGVLWPFFVAWLLAYLMYPLVIFLEKKCRLRFRILSILVAMVLVCSLVAGLLVFIVPPAIRQIGHLSDDLFLYATTYFAGTDIPKIVLDLTHNFDRNTIIQLFQNNEVMDAVRTALHQSWGVVSGTMNVVWYVVDFLMGLLYLIFLLVDYENINKNWILIVPHDYRDKAWHLASDMKREMNLYFRGQATVASLVGILFSIGFLIIDFPMAIGFGLFVGLLNIVPYLQITSIVPMVFLALVKAANTGENFWWILIAAGIVMLVVQVIQETILIPRIMNKAIGLHPAVILLSLSIWGSLLGLVGMIIALPATSLILSYYRQFLRNQEAAEKSQADVTPKVEEKER
jgi:predicted PurR-regulated permease PerM